MVRITIKFLVGFSLRLKETKATKQKPEKPTAKKNPTNESNEEDPPFLIRLEKSCSTAHIEYQLFPMKCKPYHIDVLCWTNAAKIYTSDSVKIFKTVSRNGLTFVPVCIQHYIKEMSVDELMALQKYAVEFQFSTDKAKLGNQAKSNKTEKVYLREVDIGRTDFVELYFEQVNASVTTSSKKSKITEAETIDDDNLSRNTIYQRNEVFSRMMFEENFAEHFYPIIEYICDNSIPRDRIKFKDFVGTCDPIDDSNGEVRRSTVKTGLKLEKTEKGKMKDRKKQTEKPSSKLTLQMQGEVLFTDTNPIFRLENYKSELTKVFVIASVENLLTRFQKIHMNPIIVKIQSIQNFPAECFENTGFTHLYCKYSIPFIAECKTIEKPIDKSIWFMESHIYPTHNLSKIKLLEFLAASRLIVEVYGLQRYQNVEPTPKLFGEKQSDCKISTINPKAARVCTKEEEKTKVHHVLLAYSSYDLSSLLKNVWDFRAKQQLHVAENEVFGKRYSPQLIDINPGQNEHSLEFWTNYDISLNQINLAGISINNAEKSPLKEWILLENNTVLNLEAYLLSPQSPALVLHQIPNTFKRLLLICSNRDMVVQWFGNIIRHNQRIMFDDVDNDDFLTGFCFDNGNTFVIYVEGRSIGYILNLWRDLDLLTPQDGKVFFNTDQAYESRLYNICNKWSGFFIVTMKIPFEMIFKKQQLYIKGNVPSLCQKALMKINLLLLTRTMKSMLQMDLFPTLEELVSLDIEYGITYGWKYTHSADTPYHAPSEVEVFNNWKANFKMNEL